MAFSLVGGFTKGLGLQLENVNAKNVAQIMKTIQKALFFFVTGFTLFVDLFI
jgi:hypothetical protein